MFEQVVKPLGIGLGFVAATLAVVWLLCLLLPPSFVFPLLLFLVALFMILLVLVQRGRGGGLAGALGGPGGSSAFGAKAGDVFTKITIYTAVVWIVLCVNATYWANSRGDAFGDGPGAFAGQNQAEASIDLGGGAGALPAADGEADAADEADPGDTLNAVEEDPLAEE